MYGIEHTWLAMGNKNFKNPKCIRIGQVLASEATVAVTGAGRKRNRQVSRKTQKKSLLD